MKVGSSGNCAQTQNGQARYTARSCKVDPIVKTIFHLQ